MRQFLIIMLLTLAMGCSEVIQVEIGSVEKSIVIYGYVSSDEQIQKVEVSSTIPYSDTDTNYAISGAEVTINHYPFSEDPDSAGLYLSTVPFKAEKDSTYTLTVKYDFDNDGTEETYTASTTLADSCCIVGGHMVKSDMIGIKYYTPYLSSVGLSDDEFWYVYFSVGDSVLVENLSDISIIDASTMISSEPVEYIPFMDMMNFNAMYFSKENQEEVEKMFDSTSNSQPIFLGVGDTIKVSVCTMQEDFYDFITVLKKSTGSSNPIFGSGTVFLPTNFTGGALGYFGSLNEKQVNIVVEE